MLEERRVVVEANVLEHADRNDAIERAGDIAIILQKEAGLRFQLALGGTLLRDRQLFGRQGDAGDVGSVCLGEKQAQTPVTRADVENAHPRLQQKLRREMALLRHLS